MPGFITSRIRRVRVITPRIRAIFPISPPARSLRCDGQALEDVAVELYPGKLDAHSNFTEAIAALMHAVSGAACTATPVARFRPTLRGKAAAQCLTGEIKALRILVDHSVGVVDRAEA